MFNCVAYILIISIVWIYFEYLPFYNLVVHLQNLSNVFFSTLLSNVQLLVDIFFKFLTFLFNFKILKMIPRNGGMVVSNVIPIV
jgi:hypothetical protein